MKAIAHRIISVLACVAMATAVYLVSVTGVRYTVTFTVTLDDRAYTQAEVASIREAAENAFFLKEKQIVGKLEGKPPQFIVKLSDVTRDNLMWLMSQQLSRSISPLKSGVPEAPDKNINIRCVPYLPPLTLALMIFGLVAVFFLGRSFAQAGRMSDRKESQEKPHRDRASPRGDPLPHH
jgi:hypothetical protein